MSHVMFDLETWGTSPGCALRSIGAVVFDPMSMDRWCGETFYQNISPASCEAVGLRVESATAAWWEQQPLEAVVALRNDQRNIIGVVDDFHHWFQRVGGEFIWCHGASFDEPLWTGVVRQLNRVVMNRFAVPWKFWNIRCTRTVYWAAQFDPKTIKREGVAHNALDDAVYQAQCVQAAMKILHAPPNTKKFLPAEIADVD